MEPIWNVLIPINASTWVMLLAFVVTVLGFVSTVDEKRKKLWNAMIVVCALFIFLAGIRAQQEQDSFQKQIIAKSEEIAGVNRELAKKSDEISSKSDKIEELTREIAFMSTGGDSFCFVRFQFFVGSPDTPTLAVFHKGKYPLHNVSIAITDYEAAMSAVPNVPRGKSQARPVTLTEMRKFEAARAHVDMGTVGPGSGTLVKLWKLPDREIITYSIQIQSLFQTFHQHLKLHRVKGRWQQAFRVHKKEPEKDLVVLLEEVPKEFPMGQEGKIDWNYQPPQ